VLKFQVSRNRRGSDWKRILNIKWPRQLKGRARKPVAFENNSTEIPRSKVDPRMAEINDINARNCMGNLPLNGDGSSFLKQVIDLCHLLEYGWLD